MWFFMNTCYLLSLLTFGMLLLALLQSFFHFFIFKANHLTFMILTSIIYLFTETLIIFFFVGTGVSIKEYTLEHHLKPDYHRKSIAVKRRVYPPLLLNMLCMIILFALVGAVDTGRISVWIYQTLFGLCIVHFIFVKKIQHECFRDNTNNILRMAGVEGV